jgi:large subunit ribosomal protein L15
VIKNTRTDVKVLGQGDLKKKLSVTAHAFSASAREKIEKAGGTATALRPPREEKRKKRTAKPKPEAEPVAEEAPESDETPNQEST